MVENPVLVTQSPGVWQIELNRAEKKNALTQRMYQSMTQALIEAEANEQARAVVISGRGDDFCSGNDLLDFANAIDVSDPSNPILEFMHQLRQFSKPVVVAAKGHCVGIGVTMFLHADLIYCSKDASLSMPFVKLGLCPEYASSYLVPRIVGHSKAFEWLVLGQHFDGLTAESFGLVNKAVDEPDETALSIAKLIASMPPNAVKTAKSLLLSKNQPDISEAIDAEVQSFSAALKGTEFQQAVAAFFSSRAK